jgi:hypothetical protein
MRVCECSGILVNLAQRIVHPQGFNDSIRRRQRKNLIRVSWARDWRRFIARPRNNPAVKAAGIKRVLFRGGKRGDALLVSLNNKSA